MKFQELIDELIHTDAGIEHALQEMKKRLPLSDDMRTACITRLSEWHELAGKEAGGRITEEKARVRKAELRDGATKIAQFVDRRMQSRGVTIESEAEELITEHKRVAGLADEEFATAVSALESAGGSHVSTVLALGARSTSYNESVQKFTKAQNSICLVVKGDHHIGTGFLIDQSHIMTCDHVFQEALKYQGTFRAVFDHVGSVPFDQLPSAEIDIRTAIPSSPTQTNVLARSGDTDLDYAVLKLTSSMSGRDPLNAAGESFSDKDAVIVMGHPWEKMPLHVGIGAIRDINSHHKTISYTAGTAPGSSGSPVFSVEHELKGIHQHGQSNVNGHGIQIGPVVSDLKQKGFKFFC